MFIGVSLKTPKINKINKGEKNMENKKELTRQEKEIMEFVWNKITPPKTINESDLTDKVKATYDILGKKTSNELTKNGVAKKFRLLSRKN